MTTQMAATPTMNSDAATSSAAQSATAATVPAPRHSGRARTSSAAGSAGSKRPSGTSATSAPAASHTLASIDDEEESKRSGAAAAADSSPAPSNKRARTTKHTTAAAASSSSVAAQSSPMIRILSRDTGAQFALCEMLTLKGIGRLHRCCRSWRHWINEGAFGSNRSLQLEWRVPLSLHRSAWAPRYVQRLTIEMVLSVESNEDFGDSEADADPAKAGHPQSDAGAFEKGRLEEIMLHLLTRLNRLRALELELYMPGGQIVLPRILPLTSATLTTLVLAASGGPYLEPVTPAFLRSVGGLPSLTSLHITLQRTYESLADLDFSILPSLTQLQSLFILTNHLVRCSPAQVAALVACRALTALNVGVWGPVGASSTDEAVQRKAGLIKLIQERSLNGAARLRNIRLGTLDWKSIVTPAVAEVLLTLHELESLEHVVWSSALTSEHWAQLSLFTRLHTVHIGVVHTERTELSEGKHRASLQLDAPLQALQHCPSLSSVSLTGLAWSCWLSLSTEHAALLAALPRLQSLSLRDVYLESLAPLTAAPALMHLALDNCSGLGAQSFSLRSAVSHLPLLTSLTINGAPQHSLLQ